MIYCFWIHNAIFTTMMNEKHSEIMEQFLKKKNLIRDMDFVGFAAHLNVSGFMYKGFPCSEFYIIYYIVKIHSFVIQFANSKQKYCIAIFWCFGVKNCWIDGKRMAGVFVIFISLLNPHKILYQSL